MTVQEDYQPVFTGKVLEELQTVLQRYPNKQAALLPALWLAQREHGWISDHIMAEVAEVLGLTPAYVKGVVTFYTMYHQHPVGKNFVQVCTTSPCNICGAEEVLKALLEHSGAGDAGATRDRKSTRLNSSHVSISYAVFCLKKRNGGSGRAGAK